MGQLKSGLNDIQLSTGVDRQVPFQVLPAYPN